MTHTNPSDEILDFIEYVRHFPEGRAFVEASAGASPEDVARFVQLARYPLPRIYQGFLLRFGRSDGGLCLAADGSTSLEEVIKFYEDQIPVAYWDVPVLGIVVSTPGLTGSRSFVYDDDMTATPRVTVNWGENVYRVISDSARNWLYQTAYSRFRVRRSSTCPDYVSFNIARDGGEVFSTLSETAAALGLAPMWFSDSCVYCGESDNLRVCLFAEPSHVAVTMVGTHQACLALTSQIKRCFRVQGKS
jgi:hypothetical protein